MRINEISFTIEDEDNCPTCHVVLEHYGDCCWDAYVYDNALAAPLEEFDGRLGMWYVERGKFSRRAEDEAEDACRTIHRAFRAAMDACGEDAGGLPWGEHDMADIPPLWMPWFYDPDGRPRWKLAYDGIEAM